MKTMKTMAVYLFLVSELFGLTSSVYSQDIKLSRRERKEVRKTQMEADFYILDSLLKVRAFVLEADYLQNKYGDRISVMPTLNFIRISESKGTLQTGNATSIGYNGVGGVTAEGNIGTWKIYKNTRGLSYNLRFSLMTNIGHFDVVMNLGSNGHATAIITGLTSNKLIWEGRLVTLDKSRVFKSQQTL